ncbi:hypothetical protein C8J57DRAFT_1244548 [Mycena rebaudengoi]|nr:hypothetical protein C8J57DRAFT_1244548 [Mycena rebaudengoi]
MCKWRRTLPAYLTLQARCNDDANGEQVTWKQWRYNHIFGSPKASNRVVLTILSGEVALLGVVGSSRHQSEIQVRWGPDSCLGIPAENAKIFQNIFLCLWKIIQWMTFHGGLNSLGTIRASLRVPLWAWPVINRVFGACVALEDEGGDDPLILCEQCLPQQPAGSDEERGHEAQHGVRHELRGEHKQRGMNHAKSCLCCMPPETCVNRASRAVLSVRVEAWGGLSSAGGRAVVIPKERKGGGSVSVGNQVAQAAGKDVGSGGGRVEEGGLQAGRARTSAAAMLWLLERVTRGFCAGKFDKRDLWEEEEEEDVLPEHWPKPFI